MLHLGPIWYHSEPSDVPYSENLLRPISWFGLFLQQNDSSKTFISIGKMLICTLYIVQELYVHIISGTPTAVFSDMQVPLGLIDWAGTATH